MSNRTVCRVFAAAFAVLLALGVHGFSIGRWDSVMDGRTDGSSFFQIGKPQPLRSDEWMVSLPLVQAQCRSPDRFPAFNRDVLPVPVDVFAMTPPCPVLDWTLPGQFSNWGYFLFGFDRGLSWSWLSRYLLLPLAAYLVFLRWTRNDRAVSAVAAAFVWLGAPTQWWSTTVPYLLLHFFGTILFAGALRTAERPLRAVAAGAGLFVCATSFLFSFYPPFQWPLLVLLAGCARLGPADAPPARGRRTRAAVFAAVAALVAAELLYAGLVHAETFRTVAASDYPGGRISTGGPFRSGIGLQLHKFIALFDSFRSPGRTNACELAEFFVPVLPLAAALALRIRRAGLPRRAVPALAVCGGLLLWTLVRTPAVVARWTGLAFVPPQRAAVVLGFGLSVGLFVLFAANRRRGVRASIPVALALAAGCSALAFAAVLATPDVRGWFFLEGDRRPGLLAAAILLHGAIGFGLLRASRRVFLPACLAAAVLSGWFVHPVCRGAAPMRDGAFVDLARRIEAEHGRGTWIAPDEYVQNGLAGNGFRVLGGVHCHAHPELWRIVDPDGVWKHVWNRYAHVQLAVTDTPVSFPRLLNPAKFIWNLSAPDAAALGVDYLVEGRDGRDVPPWKTPVGELGNRVVYRLDRNAAARAAGPPPADD